MAHDDQEIEIKIPVSEEIFQKVRENLLKLALSKGKTQQIDKYFSPSHRNFISPKFPFEWLSIRRRGEKSIITYKHWYPEGEENNTHCDEYQTEIADPEKLEKILSVLDFKELVIVDKTREKFVINDEFDVCLDSVKDLGYFIEIESIADHGTVDETRSKLIQVAKDIGIDNSVMDKRGYPYELMRKKGLLSEIKSQ